MAYEALYRRYRPSKFGDIAGQSHVVSALRNAVEGDRVGHAYLFSGPRGTGKTSSARILAKALNCTNLQGGEPCDECASCLAFKAGGSYDLHELDAASNNGVDAMRDLISKVALGSPGRTKVYILDEVHMLTSGAENTLLKTLEEPPAHVVFVLCTTEPNKVVPTIRSRTQHLEFSLLTTDELGAVVDHVVADAGLSLDEADRAYVIRAGGGSARDTLSALDRVVAAGGAPQGGEYLDALFQALIDNDGRAALAAIDGALHAGRDAATVATELLAELRGVFLAAMNADIDHLPQADRERAVERAAALPPARITRAIETIGASIIEMRQAPDPRVDLEVAVLRLVRADLDTDPAALLQRIEALEHRLAGHSAAVGGPAATAPPATGPGGAADPGAASSPPSGSAPPRSESPADRGDGVDEPAPTVAARPSGSPSDPPGKRGADMVRAALAEQSAPTSPSSPQGRPDRGASAAPSPSDAAAGASSKGGVRTLADVRRERQQAAEGGGGPARQVGPSPDSSGAGRAATPTSEATPTAAPGPGSAPPAADARPAATEPRATGPQAAQSGPATAGDGAGSLPALAELEAAWPSVLETVSGRVRSRFSAGRFLESSDAAAQFGLPNPVHRDRCEEVRAEIDRALSTRFGGAVPLEIVVDTAEVEPDIFSSPPSRRDLDDHDPDYADDEGVDIDGLVDATDPVPSGVDRVLATFEGSVVLDDRRSDPSDR